MLLFSKGIMGRCLLSFQRNRTVKSNRAEQQGTARRLAFISNSTALMSSVIFISPFMGNQYFACKDFNIEPLQVQYCFYKIASNIQNIILFRIIKTKEQLLVLQEQILNKESMNRLLNPGRAVFAYLRVTELPVSILHR